MRKALLCLAGLALASIAPGGLSKFRDWAKSPEAYFLTAAEREGWSRINTDEDAEKFVEQYRGKRAGGNPVTGGKDFWAEIQRRIAAGDQQFKLNRHVCRRISTPAPCAFDGGGVNFLLLGRQKFFWRKAQNFSHATFKIAAKSCPVFAP